jgi:hypothetical protein
MPLVRVIESHAWREWLSHILVLCEVRTKAEVTVKDRAYNTAYTLSYIWGTSWGWRNSWALNILHTDGSTPIDEINAWFAIKIKKSEGEIYPSCRRLPVTTDSRHYLLVPISH